MFDVRRTILIDDSIRKAVTEERGNVLVIPPYNEFTAAGAAQPKCAPAVPRRIDDGIAAGASEPELASAGPCRGGDETDTDDDVDVEGDPPFSAEPEVMQLVAALLMHHVVPAVAEGHSVVDTLPVVRAALASVRFRVCAFLVCCPCPKVLNCSHASNCMRRTSVGVSH